MSDVVLPGIFVRNICVALFCRVGKMRMVKESLGPVPPK